MKLTDKRRLGRYARPDGSEANIWKARDDGGWDVRYYLFRGKPVVICEADFFRDWKRVSDWKH